MPYLMVLHQASNPGVMSLNKISEKNSTLEDFNFYLCSYFEPLGGSLLRFEWSFALPKTFYSNPFGPFGRAGHAVTVNYTTPIFSSIDCYDK